MTTCLDCHARIPERGRPAKRCPACTLEYNRTYNRDRYQGFHPDGASVSRTEIRASEVYAFIEQNAPVAAHDIGLKFWGSPRDVGQIAAKLDGAGYLVWTDKHNKLHPYRRRG